MSFSLCSIIIKNRLDTLRNIYLYKHDNFTSYTKMPKKASNQNVKKNKNISAQDSNLAPVFLGPNDQIYIKIHAKPGAKESEIVDIISDAIDIQIAARPVDGEANSELVRFIAEILCIKKTEINLVKGLKSREKTLSIMKNNLTVENVLEKLKLLSKKNSMETS